MDQRYLDLVEDLTATPAVAREEQRFQCGSRPEAGCPCKVNTARPDCSEAIMSEVRASWFNDKLCIPLRPAGRPSTGMASQLILAPGASSTAALTIVPSAQCTELVAGSTRVALVFGTSALRPG